MMIMMAFWIQSNKQPPSTLVIATAMASLIGSIWMLTVMGFWIVRKAVFRSRS